MKDKERFISIDDSGESIFTFDEADMIIDTKTNIVYGANNVPDLVKILNSQNSKWQELKEYLKNQIADLRHIDVKTETQSLRINDSVNCFRQVIQKMQELEAEDENNKN